MLTRFFLGSQKLNILRRNAQQLLNTVQATFPGSNFDSDVIDSSCASGAYSGIEGAQCAWSQALHLSRTEELNDAFSSAGPAFQQVSKIAQEVMSSTASNYDVFRLGLGLFVTGIAASLVLPDVYRECARSTYTGVFLTLMMIGYGSMMFASSYVEEEQQFWYWICSGWLFYLHVKSESSRRGSRQNTRSISFRFADLATLGLAISQRIIRRWNQTGQKFTAEPDIARTFFAGHPAILWSLVILTYVDAGRQLLLSLPPAAFPRLCASILPALAFMFKLNFVANDSPELLAGSFLSKFVGRWPDSFSLIWQARFVFGGLACIVALEVMTRHRSENGRSKSSSR